MPLHDKVAAVTQRVRRRSEGTRSAYLALIETARKSGNGRVQASCGNLAHAIAASGTDRDAIRKLDRMNIGIVTAYNDMLSAHQPYGRYPESMKLFAREVGATCQVAGGVPAMCDGVTQGQTGMELSLFSRDVVALSTAVALSHNMFDAVALLGICDKIVPGLLIGALRFGHLPTLFVPAGPMPSGLANKEKQRVRQAYAKGEASREELLNAEVASYHSPGTCTFYGTANSNQMMMEIMGLHIPGSAFVNPNTPLRQELTRAAVHRLAAVGANGDDYRPLGHCVDERAIVNAAVGLLATGGSTNHAIHLPAIAKAAGIQFNWDDMDDLSSCVPLIARVYPNGADDINAFHDAGGMGFAIRTLLEAGLLHRDVMTVSGSSLGDYAREAVLEDKKLVWQDAPAITRDAAVLRSVQEPFDSHGGIRLLKGNLGRAISKTSAVERSRWRIEAPARVFSDQDDVLKAFKAGELERDCVIVLIFQGPARNGMPELHKLTPALGVLQDKGFRVALVTDGRMSGASGKIPSAIHVTPEAWDGGPIGLVRDGDMVLVCAESGGLSLLVSDEELAKRTPAARPADEQGCGRELFSLFRSGAGSAESGGAAILSGL